MKKPTLNRRSFLRQSAGLTSVLTLGATGFFPTPAYTSVRSPSEKLNIGCIGIQNRGGASVAGVRHEQIIALCDIDDNYLASVGEHFPQAKRFFDYRDLFDQMGDKLDGVTVSTTDHTHAPIALAAMKRGIACYCEKPLAHSLEEVRKMVAVAKEKNLVTQMGIQIHAVENYRRAVETIRTGVLGQITDVWVWTSAGRKIVGLPEEKMECPPNIHWEQWLGPAPWREYHSSYLPGRWRAWWDFGSGRFGDMACHLTDLVFWSLNLRAPFSIHSTGPTDVHPQAAPPTLAVEYLFHPVKANSNNITGTTSSLIESPFRFPEVSAAVPAAIDLVDPFPVHWRVGAPPEILRLQGEKLGVTIPQWEQGILFVGTEGVFLVDYDRNILFPESKFGQYQRPVPSILSSKGHHAEWLEGIRTSNPRAALCDFEYGAALTETVMLGNISWRAGQKQLQWDREKMEITNVSEANSFLRKEYRKGWELE